jgi:bacterioferritin-associated ferredoxin
VLVCHCFAVNEGRVREVIADGARTEMEVAAACGAGSNCGGCVPTICWLLRQCAAADADSEPAASVR